MVGREREKGKIGVGKGDGMHGEWRRRTVLLLHVHGALGVFVGHFGCCGLVIGELQMRRCVKVSLFGAVWAGWREDTEYKQEIKMLSETWNCN